MAFELAFFSVSGFPFRRLSRHAVSKKKGENENCNVELEINIERIRSSVSGAALRRPRRPGSPAAKPPGYDYDYDYNY